MKRRSSKTQDDNSIDLSAPTEAPPPSEPCAEQEPPRYVDAQLETPEGSFKGIRDTQTHEFVPGTLEPISPNPPRYQTELHNDFYPLRELVEMVYNYMLERCSPDKRLRLDIARMFGGEEELEQEIEKEIDDLELRSIAAIHGKLLSAGPREDGFPLLTSDYVKTWLISRVPRDTYPDAHDCLQRWLDDLPAPKEAAPDIKGKPDETTPHKPEWLPKKPDSWSEVTILPHNNTDKVRVRIKGVTGMIPVTAETLRLLDKRTMHPNTAFDFLRDLLSSKSRSVDAGTFRMTPVNFRKKIGKVNKALSAFGIKEAAIENAQNVARQWRKKNPQKPIPQDMQGGQYFVTFHLESDCTS